MTPFGLEEKVIQYAIPCFVMRQNRGLYVFQGLNTYSPAHMTVEW